MSGILYGVGVGPGDPELMTLKAVRTIQECDVIGIPSLDKETCVAYQIACKAIPALSEKEILPLSMPMTKDKAVLNANYDAGANQISDLLLQNKSIAFLTLGDPTVYSTYIYLHKRVQEKGFETQIISGITSFCAVAARCNDSLVERDEPLLILPSSYSIEEYLTLYGTKVLMKSGKKMKEVKSLLQNTALEVVMVENCGMENEKIFSSVEEIPENAGYYSLIVAKEKRES